MTPEEGLEEGWGWWEEGGVEWVEGEEAVEGRGSREGGGREGRSVVLSLRL